MLTISSLPLSHPARSLDWDSPPSIQTSPDPVVQDVLEPLTPAPPRSPAPTFGLALAAGLAAMSALATASPAAAAPLCPADLSVVCEVETPQVDFSRMTQAQRYDYLEDLVRQRGVWKSEPGEVNIVGIRSFSEGRPADPQADRYDDTILLAWRDASGTRRVVSLRATTDAGVVSKPRNTGWGYWNTRGEYLGFSHLADGFFQDVWRRGQVKGDAGLRQDAEIRIHADANFDGLIQDSERLGEDLDGDGFADGTPVGAWWSIHFHRGEGDQVNTWSVGCQVIVDEDYEQFVEVLEGATNERFSYLLIDSADLPPAPPRSLRLFSVE